MDMKLPVQAAAVDRERHSLPVGRSFAVGSPAAGVAPSYWPGCPDGWDPCERNGYELATCTSGASVCCDDATTAHTKAGGACIC
jgi:hypothetical protein